MKKCLSSIRCWDSNPRPSEDESPPITTRPLVKQSWLWQNCLIISTGSHFGAWINVCFYIIIRRLIFVEYFWFNTFGRESKFTEYAIFFCTVQTSFSYLNKQRNQTEQIKLQVYCTYMPSRKDDERNVWRLRLTMLVFVKEFLSYLIGIQNWKIVLGSSVEPSRLML